MTRPRIHPKWLNAPSDVTEAYSLEVTVGGISTLTEAALRIWPGAPIAPLLDERDLWLSAGKAELPKVADR